jgi:tetratricopeptide (TPR) repeat protein
MSVRWVLLVAFLALSVSRRAAAQTPSVGTAGRPPDSSTDVDAWVGRLTGVDPGGRRAAVADIDTASPALLPGIARRLGELRKSADRDAMADVLAHGRKGSSRDDDRSAKAGDPFERIMEGAAPGEAAWRDAAAILGMSRLLARIGTTPAVRELCGIYPGFGDAFRPEVERQLKVLGEKAVATLIEIRRGDAKPLRPWAAKVLDVLGKTLPGEAVQTSDNQVLADVLRAYGRTKDVDAARVIVSFANSDRTQVREAAREAVAMLGDNGIWQLRESYENLVGKKAPEDWGWEKLSGELFAAYDRSRLSEVYVLMDEGLTAYKGGKLDAMASAFDRVLARAPNFDKRREMVGGYIEFARSIREEDRARALAILRKVVRLDPTGPRAKEAESELVYLEALDLASRGVVDEASYRRAVELDPNNADAREALRRVQSSAETTGGWQRYVLVSAFALTAVALAAIALFWRKRSLAR